MCVCTHVSMQFYHMCSLAKSLGNSGCQTAITKVTAFFVIVQKCLRPLINEEKVYLALYLEGSKSKIRQAHGFQPSCWQSPQVAQSITWQKTSSWMSVQSLAEPPGFNHEGFTLGTSSNLIISQRPCPYTT